MGMCTNAMAISGDHDVDDDDNVDSRDGNSDDDGVDSGDGNSEDDDVDNDDVGIIHEQGH